ncbi:hypothetical protein AB0I61_33335 [Polymorphospora rubra]|uniref:hypothetical protein n=1 Tax=Polymorphospora rubra TaxID=338584 RepID=UPI0033DCED1F
MTTDRTGTASRPLGTWRRRPGRMAEDEVLGLKTRAQVIAATKRGNARIAEIDEVSNASVTTDPLAAVHGTGWSWPTNACSSTGCAP